MRKHEPRPIITVLIIIGAIIILGMATAAIKIFLIPQTNQQSILQEEGTIKVYFCRQEDCAAPFKEAITSSNTSECAFYELNRNDIIKTLVNKKTKTLVYDKNAKEVRGINVSAVPSVGLMHNKFCVLDKESHPIVITGSMNPTMNDVERNDNNLIIINSKTLAMRYDQEFSELQSRSSENYKKRAPTPLTINLSGILIEQRFCPQEDCEGTVVNEIKQAKHDVVFMTFSFTSDPIGAELISEEKRGVAVSGVFEKRQLDDYTEYEKLLAQNIPVRTDGNKYTMHHKVFIIDNETVITGSYNPTKAAQERNDENMLIIHDPAIAMQYRKEFERVWTQAPDSNT